MSRILEIKTFSTESIFILGYCWKSEKLPTKDKPSRIWIERSPSINRPESDSSVQVISHSHCSMITISALLKLWVEGKNITVFWWSLLRLICFPREFIPSSDALVSQKDCGAISLLFLSHPLGEKKNTLIQYITSKKVISPKAEMPWELGAHITFDEFGSWEAHNCLFRTSDLFWPACTYGHTHK